MKEPIHMQSGDWVGKLKKEGAKGRLFDYSMEQVTEAVRLLERVRSSAVDFRGVPCDDEVLFRPQCDGQLEVVARIADAQELLRVAVQAFQEAAELATPRGQAPAEKERAS